MTSDTMAKTLDVYCLGEALVDFLPDRRGRLRDARRFEAHLGGAVANVSVGVARLGRRALFHGVLGEDELGHGLVARLRDEGVTAHVRHTPEAPTGVWFVSVDETGDRTFFTPTGLRSADKGLTAADVDVATLAGSKWLHLGTGAHGRAEAREALFTAVRAANAHGTRVSMDPNVRLPLWPDPEPLRILCRELLPLCSLVKLSEEELELCTGETRPEDAVDALIARGTGLVCVTLGAQGVYAGRGSDRFRVAAPAVEAVDTTGAGDGFVSALLARLCDAPPAELSPAEIGRHLAFACWAGSRVSTFPGAVTGLPRSADVPPGLR